MWLYLGVIVTMTVLYRYRNIQSLDTIKTYSKGLILFMKFLKQYDRKTIMNSGRQLMTYYIAQKLIEIDGKHVTIHYPYGVHWYKIRFKKKLGPSKLLGVVDENGKSCMDDIKSFMGPSHNFYNIPTDPALLGYETLTFEYMDGTQKQFQKHEIICL